MNCNIWKSSANQHIYLHLQKHTIKKKPQMFLPSFGCNALLIQEYDSICMRGKYVSLAPAVIPQPGRKKQHTPHIHFSDAQKNKTVIQIKILVPWEWERKRQAVISVTLGTSEIASPKAVLFQLSGNQEQARDWALVSVGKLCFCPRRGILQKHQPGSLVISFLI